MRVDCALLCDAVTVREGLLNILSGGVTRVTRPSYPGPLGVALAVRVMVHPTEMDRSHHLEARLLSEDGKQIGVLGAQFELKEGGDRRPGEESSAPFPMAVQAATIPLPGAYSFEILIDGIHQASVPFVAVVAGT